MCLAGKYESSAGLKICDFPRSQCMRDAGNPGNEMSNCNKFARNEDRPMVVSTLVRYGNFRAIWTMIFACTGAMP